MYFPELIATQTVRHLNHIGCMHPRDGDPTSPKWLVGILRCATDERTASKADIIKAANELRRDLIDRGMDEDSEEMRMLRLLQLERC